MFNYYLLQFLNNKFLFKKRVTIITFFHTLVVQHDTIFVTGLPEDINDSQIADYFGAIGLIKIDRKTGRQKIWIYKDKVTGRGKGEATVTYDDPPTASSAIQWFNGKEIYGKPITVQMAERRNFQPGGFRGGRGGGPRGPGGPGGYNRGGQDSGPGGRQGGGGGGQGGNSRQGDWRCPSDGCGNNNFSWRTSCNRCQTPKPEGTGDNEMNSRWQQPNFDRNGPPRMGGRGGGGGPMRGGFDRPGRGGPRGPGGFGGRGGGPPRGGGFQNRGERRPNPY